MKALDPRLLRHAAGTRRYVVVSVVIAIASGAAFVVAAFAIRVPGSPNCVAR